MKVAEVAQFLILLVPIAATVGVVVGITTFQRLDGAHRLLWLYLLLALTFDRLGHFLGAAQGTNLILVPIFGFTKAKLREVMARHSATTFKIDLNKERLGLSFLSNSLLAKRFCVRVFQNKTPKNRSTTTGRANKR